MHSIRFVEHVNVRSGCEGSGGVAVTGIGIVWVRESEDTADRTSSGAAMGGKGHSSGGVGEAAFRGEDEAKRIRRQGRGR